MEDKLKVLFLCTGNSCRSQMAEAFLNTLRGDRYIGYSAGLKPGELDRRAVKVMAELGMDISKQRPKDLEAVQEIEFDYVITLCDNARESCPYFPAKKKMVHVGFEDPPKLALLAKDEEEALKHYRRVRDEIRAFILDMEKYI